MGGGAWQAKNKIRGEFCFRQKRGEMALSVCVLVVPSSQAQPPRCTAEPGRRTLFCRCCYDECVLAVQYYMVLVPCIVYSVARGGTAVSVRGKLEG